MKAKKENLSMIIYLFGTIVEIILLLYVKSFKTGQGIHLSNYLKNILVVFKHRFDAFCYLLLCSLCWSSWLGDTIIIKRIKYK